MEVGAIEQTVAVTAEAPLVNTTSGSLGGLVDSRNPTRLVSIQSRAVRAALGLWGGMASSPTL